MSQVDEARAMLDSPTMKAVVEAARQEAYKQLAEADPHDPAQILGHQATLRALDSIQAYLRAIINRDFAEKARKNARK